MLQPAIPPPTMTTRAWSRNAPPPARRDGRRSILPVSRRSVNAAIALPAFTGGVFVAAGDINPDGIVDIITGAGPGGRPQVRVIDGRPDSPFATSSPTIPPSPAGFGGGRRRRPRHGHGRAGPGGGPHVRVFDSLTGLLVRDVFSMTP